MNRIKTAILLSVISLIASAATAADFIYTPALIETNEALPADGILVQEVTVKKGDTLYNISKQFAGKGHYYPQILLFNNIKNPNLIYTGDTLRIPIQHYAVKRATHKKTAKHNDSAKQWVTTIFNQQQKAPVSVHNSAANRHITAKNQTVLAITDEQQLFDKTEKMMTSGNYPAALPLLDEFLTRYPKSALAPQAALNRAECFLKMSNP